MFNKVHTPPLDSSWYWKKITNQRETREIKIPVEDDTCCLCDKLIEGTYINLFSTCERTVRVKTKLQQWSGTLIPAGAVKHILNRLIRKIWQQFYKELIVALCLDKSYLKWMV
ncbi:hypothetical protein H5410_055125 [Solanum commersonii]|uniref:Uncharacterized protein n=1 Tax=Solanum commersonii TaxID=4109 RepID=A0A9J5WI53_SOLCO|nr:hypothetical protein H5410_055125 [Solanum commersonii]